MGWGFCKCINAFDSTILCIQILKLSRNVWQRRAGADVTGSLLQGSLIVGNRPGNKRRPCLTLAADVQLELFWWFPITS